MVFTKIWNELKRDETSQNEPKPAKTSQNHQERPQKIAKQPKTNQ